MAQYTLSEAAKVCGRSKSTVLRSIRAGRISAVRDELTGGWLIEPAELFRLYPESGGTVHRAADDVARNGHNAPEMTELRARLTDAHETIADLRARLDTATVQLGEGAVAHRSANGAADRGAAIVVAVAPIIPSARLLSRKIYLNGSGRI
jgi:excisionase family DNA binding protein